MEGYRADQRDQVRAKLLQTLGIDAATGEHARLLEEYEFGLRAASASLRMDATARGEFEALVTAAIMACHKGWPSIKKSDIRSRFMKGNTTSSAFANRAIDLGLRIWLMLDCCTDESTGCPKLWPDDQPIKAFVESRFDIADVEDPAEPITRFPRKFRAVNLHELGNITVQWTSFLDEHLSFDEDKREVKIFNNKSWLVAMVKRSRPSVARAAQGTLPDPSDSEKERSSISTSERIETGIPKELLIETLKTLYVLFPHWHEPTEQFLESQNQVFHQLPPFPRDVPKLREFRYWKYRLLDLIVEYESPPLDWKHIWRDRRNPTAFWTFWIGIAIFLLTLIFGISSSVLAGIQIELAEAALKPGGQS